VRAYPCRYKCVSTLASQTRKEPKAKICGIRFLWALSQRRFFEGMYCFPEVIEPGVPEWGRRKLGGIVALPSSRTRWFKGKRTSPPESLPLEGHSPALNCWVNQAKSKLGRLSCMWSFSICYMHPTSAYARGGTPGAKSAVEVSQYWTARRTASGGPYISVKKKIWKENP